MEEGGVSERSTSLLRRDSSEKTKPSPLRRTPTRGPIRGEGGKVVFGGGGFGSAFPGRKRKKRAQNEKRRPPDSVESGGRLFRRRSWRRPTLPRGLPRSTIGAEELNFRVRNGNGCRLFAIAANFEYDHPKAPTHSRRPICGQVSRPISTGPLNALPHVYARPINLVVFEGSSVDMSPCRGGI